MNKWNSKRIAFISILIAMSISFVIIGTRFAAVSSLPSFKLSLAGLPIKIIGYTFGPITGFITGFITDIISFVFMPAFYFPVYSIALGVSGMIPGFVCILFNYLIPKFEKRKLVNMFNLKKIIILHEIKLATIKNDEQKILKQNKKYDKIGKKIDKINSWKKEKVQLDFSLISGLSILMIVLISLISIFIVIPQSVIDSSLSSKGILKLLSNKMIFVIIITLGIIACMLILVICRYKMKNENNFFGVVVVVVFVVLTEYINIPIVAYADSKALKIDFVTSMIASLATSILKILFNTVIISFAIRIVVPLITKKTFNGY